MTETHIIETGAGRRIHGINVLDHGYVRLIDSMGSDLSVARAARVSYDAAWRAGKDAGSDERLIRYLWKNKHTSPFEAVEFQFEVRAPIFVMRQWHRHRTWSYNELSGRYRALPELFYVPDHLKIGRQSVDNKQMRVIDDDPEIDLIQDRAVEVDDYERQCSYSFRQYKRLLECGWPRETARMVLPLSTYSDMFAKVDLHNLLHFLNLRTHEHAQYEIQEYARAILSLIEPIIPVCVAAWKESQ